MITEDYEYDALVNRLKERVKNGDVQAMRHLGDLLFQGSTGKDKNLEAAFIYWKMAADHGDLGVTGKVGMMYLLGNGTSENKSEGLKYLLVAAEHSDVFAQRWVGKCYESGSGCKINKKSAMKYYRMAALQNDAESQYALGSLLFLSKDSNYLHWFCCAHINGYSKATDILNDFMQHGLPRSVVMDCIAQIEKK